MADADCFIGRGHSPDFAVGSQPVRCNGVQSKTPEHEIPSSSVIRMAHKFPFALDKPTGRGAAGRSLRRIKVFRAGKPASWRQNFMRLRLAACLALSRFFARVEACARVGVGMWGSVMTCTRCPIFQRFRPASFVASAICAPWGPIAPKNLGRTTGSVERTQPNPIAQQRCT